MKIKLTADSTCDLSEELCARYGVKTIPLHVSLGERQLRDGVDVVPQEIFAHVSAGGDLPTTAAVNAWEYETFFEETLRDCDALIHVNVGSGFSSCHQNAKSAAQAFDSVYCVDSANLSTGSALLLAEAAEKIGEGAMSAAEIAAYLGEMASRVEASFVIDRLDYLHKGGRCSAVTLLGANMLKLRPCIEVAEGAMRVGKKYRGSFARCVQQYIEDRLRGREDVQERRIFLTHAGCSQEILTQAELQIRRFIQPGEVLVTSAGCTVSCHCGPGTLGILFVRREEGDGCAAKENVI